MLSFLLILCVSSTGILFKVKFYLVCLYSCLFSVVNRSVFCFELAGIDVFFLSMFLCLLCDRIMMSVINPAYC